MEHLAEKIADNWNKKLHLNEIEFVKMKYGLEVIFINITKLFIIISIAFFIGIGIDTIIICITCGILKFHTFGEHAKSSIVCTVISCISHVVIPYLTMNIVLDNFIFIGVSAVMIACIYRYAPSDTEKHPLIGEEKRKSLKRNAVITAVVVTLVTLVIPYNRMTMLVLLSEVYIVIAILPITYKILRRKRNNYEEYE